MTACRRCTSPSWTAFAAATPRSGLPEAASRTDRAPGRHRTADRGGEPTHSQPEGGPGRGFDAIVVGEYERAFHGQQREQLTPTLVKHGVQLWLPETYGPVDFDNPRQLALLDLLGVHSQREVSRARHRTTAAMRAQAELQGRHLGGRPPYGYRLVDAGPHPNRAHAAWGRRLHRLEPDPTTAPHVRVDLPTAA
jgi:hypothetical protein